MMVLASFACLRRPVDESLVDIGLHDREFHARVVANCLMFCGRTRRGQNIQRDRGIGTTNLARSTRSRIGALSLAVTILYPIAATAPSVKAKRRRHERADELPGHVIPPLVWSWGAQPRARGRPLCIAWGRNAPAPCLSRVRPVSPPNPSPRPSVHASWRDGARSPSLPA